MLYEGKTRYCTARLSAGMGKNFNESQYLISNSVAF